MSGGITPQNPESKLKGVGHSRPERSRRECPTPAQHGLAEIDKLKYAEL
jgi:hypothetical protein